VTGMTGNGCSTTTCPACGAQVDGLGNRYHCSLCDWVSPPDDETPPDPADKSTG
jgi:hypothetical protein